MESHQKKYSKAPDEIMAVVAFLSSSCQPCLVLTIDSVSDVSRVTRGLAIRRAKKRLNPTNDKRMKICCAEI